MIPGRPAQLRDELKLRPHPEGGWYREEFRSGGAVRPDDGRNWRSALTVIYFLLQEGEHSAWHVVASDECWMFAEGAALELMEFDPRTGRRCCIELGPTSLDRTPLHVVPAGVWQAARSTGDFTLTSCVVAPGFDFADFAMVRDLQGQPAAVRELGEWTRFL